MLVESEGGGLGWGGKVERKSGLGEQHGILIHKMKMLSFSLRFTSQGENDEE